MRSRHTPDIAAFKQTLRYIHLSGRELAQKIAKLADLEQLRLKELTE